MIRHTVPVLVIALFGSVSSAHEVVTAGPDVVLHVTINPEARVSVRREGALRGKLPCSAVELPVRIFNEAFVTGALRVELSDSAAVAAVLDFDDRRLSGQPFETRKLRIRLARSGAFDLAIAFRLQGELPDLGGRGQTHILIRCDEINQNAMALPSSD